MLFFDINYTDMSLEDSPSLSTCKYVLISSTRSQDLRPFTIDQDGTIRLATDKLDHKVSWRRGANVYFRIRYSSYVFYFLFIHPHLAEPG